LDEFRDLETVERIEAYIALGEELFDSSPADALTVTQKALGIAEKNYQYRLACNALLLLGEINAFLDDFENELVCYKKGLSYAKKISDSEILLVFYFSIGFYHQQRLSYDDALSNYLEALSIIGESSENTYLPSLYNQIGNVYYNISKFEEALKYYFKALALKETENNRTSEAKTLLNIGTVYSELNNYRKALEYLEQSLKIFQEGKPTKDQSLVLNNIGNIYRGIENYQKSIEYLNKSLKISIELKDTKRIADIYNNLGASYEEMGEYNKSNNYYQEALKIYLNYNDPLGISATYRNLGNVTIKLGNSQLAKEYLDKAMSISIENNLLIVKKNVFYSYAILYSNLGDHKTSDIYYNRHIRLSDSLNNAEYRQRVAQMQVVYETEKKDKENQVLKLENEAKENSIAQQKNLILFLGLVALLLVMIAVLIYIFYRNRKRSAAALAQKNKLLTESEEAQRMMNATKDKFFSIISHDLRNPLGSLSLIVDNLKFNIDKMDKNKLKKVLDSLDETVDGTKNLLSNLLDWSRTQTGRIDFEPMRLELTELVNSSLPLFKSTADSKQIKLHTSIEKDVFIYADRNMISTVLRNLVSNAIKFTPKGGSISLVVTKVNGFAETSVVDTGVGIDPEVVPQLFRIDSKIKTKGTENEQGTGLGLILCKEFVEKNNGQISAVSELNRGSKFSFTIPIN